MVSVKPLNNPRFLEAGMMSDQMGPSPLDTSSRVFGARASYGLLLASRNERLFVDGGAIGEPISVVMGS